MYSKLGTKWKVKERDAREYVNRKQSLLTSALFRTTYNIFNVHLDPPLPPNSAEKKKRQKVSDSLVEQKNLTNATTISTLCSKILIRCLICWYTTVY